MSKILIAPVLTDLHLKPENRSAIISVFQQTIDFAKQAKFEYIICMGDVFDSRKEQSQEILNTFELILDMCHENGIVLILIPGNHDKTDYASEDSFLNPYTHHPGLVLIKRYYRQVCPQDENVVFHFLPFFRDDVYNTYLNEAIEHIHKQPGEQHFMFTHIGVDGAKMNNGKLVEGIKQTSFQPFDKVFVGHYHDKQQLSDRFVYVGASVQHNFGESQEKGLTLVYNDGSIDTLPLNFPRYTTLEVDVKTLTPSDIQDIKNWKETNNENIKIVLLGEEAEIAAFNKKQLLDIGVKVEKKATIVEKEEIDSRIEAFTVTSLRDEFDQFCNKNSLDVQQGLGYLNRILNG